MKRIVSAILVASIMVLTCSFAFAQEESKIYELDSDDIIYSEELIGTGNESLGTDEDITGFFLPDPPEEDIALPNAIMGYQMFGMTAAEVTNLLVSNYADRSKHFRSSDLTNGNLIIMARVFNVDSTVRTTKIGACYYTSLTGTYIPQVFAYYTNGVLETRMWPKSSFSAGQIYYGFIKNEVQRGYISGYANFYDASGATNLIS